MSDRSILIALKAVAAQAEKLADDYERNRLWPGELGSALAEIRRSLDSIGVSPNE